MITKLVQCCTECGKVGVLPTCKGSLCTSCLYRNGGKIPEWRKPSPDALTMMNQPAGQRLYDAAHMEADEL